MTFQCSECKEIDEDENTYKFSFTESDKSTFKLSYITKFELCLKCFNEMFSVSVFASKFLGNPKEMHCCACKRKLNRRTEHFSMIQCYNMDYYLQLFYCDKCYKEDVGT